MLEYVNCESSVLDLNGVMVLLGFYDVYIYLLEGLLCVGSICKFMLNIDFELMKDIFKICVLR